MTDQKIGVVTRIYPGFAVVRAVGVSDGSVTFSNAAWQGSRPVSCRAVVVLGDLEFFPKGWRAGTARPISPDEINPGLREEIAALGSSKSATSKEGPEPWISWLLKWWEGSPS